MHMWYLSNISSLCALLLPQGDSGEVGDKGKPGIPGPGGPKGQPVSCTRQQATVVTASDW